MRSNGGVQPSWDAGRQRFGEMNAPGGPRSPPARHPPWKAEGGSDTPAGRLPRGRTSTVSTGGLRPFDLVFSSRSRPEALRRSARGAAAPPVARASLCLPGRVPRERIRRAVRGSPSFRTYLGSPAPNRRIPLGLRPQAAPCSPWLIPGHPVPPHATVPTTAARPSSRPPHDPLKLEESHYWRRCR